MFINNYQILQALPNPFVEENINKTDLHGCTPLHLAYLYEHDEGVKWLLECSAREDIIDNFGTTPKDHQERNHDKDNNYEAKNTSNKLNMTAWLQG